MRERIVLEVDELELRVVASAHAVHDPARHRLTVPGRPGATQDHADANHVHPSLPFRIVDESTALRWTCQQSTWAVFEDPRAQAPPERSDRAAVDLKTLARRGAVFGVLAAVLAFILVLRFGGPGAVRVVDDLGEMAAAGLAALTCLGRAMVSSGRVRAKWFLL